MNIYFEMQDLPIFYWDPKWEFIVGMSVCVWGDGGDPLTPVHQYNSFTIIRLVPLTIWIEEEKHL